MGRPFRTSNPYYTLNGTADAVNPSAKWTKRTFDKLGRVTLLTLPDNNTVQVDYEGDTVTDQAGKQRRQITDALGRVERVDEPRVETTANGETRQVVYDAFGQVVAEYVGGLLARDYIYRGGQVIATVEAGAVGVRYVMSDLQGSARVTMDASGGILARHDYLPFGEEIQSGTGSRTTAQGYGAADERKQKYALLERDPETGQDHASWRKYENTSGRWTTPDPFRGSMNIGNP
jgi:hypothetical protein